MKNFIKKFLSIRLRFEVKNFIEYFKGANVNLKKSEYKKIFFLDAASYNNLGDQAIAYAISKFAYDNFSDYDYIEILEKDFLRNFNYIKKNIKENDIIFLSGGGNMGNLYPRYEAIRRKVISNFKNNKIVIFPQTIDYENNSFGKKELKNSIKIYNANNNLVICARENKSFEFMKQIYKNVIFVPDIVLYLQKTTLVNSNTNDNILGICLRDDKEKVISNDVIEQINKIQTEKNILTTMSNKTVISNIDRESILKKKLQEFANCRLVITDRLHGMIFSIITNTPCIAFDNSNKKVSGVYETLNSKIKSTVCFKNNEKIADINKIIETVLNEDSKTDLEFEEFDNLVKIIRS